ncbi:hypothetical protein [Methanothrix harundinacea]|uniref:hypothetical protein n=1 Tax=Methanothrix harundinacea TaxID=301375 RepID=UPI00064FE8FE|nr:hypothetical protein [Methanothrix harundinacea]
MNRIIFSIVLIMALMGCVSAIGGDGGVGMRPGEAAAEERFERGLGGPWVGGDPWPRGDLSTGQSFGHSHPKFYSIFRPGFPFSGYHYWGGVHIRPFRVCHPFSDCDCQFYYPRNYYSGWVFQG